MRAAVHLRVLGASALTALLAGCAVGPDYHRPSVPLPAHFTSAGTQPGQAPPALEAWWTGFNDPSLDAVIRQALQQNLDLSQALARIDQARAGLQSAHAALLPAGDVSAQAARAHESLEDPVIAAEAASIPGFNRNDDDYTVGVGASWELDLFGGLRRSAEAARAEYQASEAAGMAARLEVISATADTYVLIRTLQARLDLARQQTATQAERLRLISLLDERGLAPDSQALQVQAAYASVAATVPDLEAKLVASRNALDVLLGRVPGTPDQALDAVAPIPASPAINTATGPAELMRRRPDIIVAERRLAASNAHIGEALSDYYPKFSLSALAGSTTTESGDLFKSPANEALGAFGMRWRLFDFGRVDAEVKAARGQNAEALAAYRLSVLNAAADVETAFSSWEKSSQQSALLESGVGALKRATASEQAGFSTGHYSRLDVLDVEFRLESLEDAQILSQSANTRAAIVAFSSLGGGWDGNLQGNARSLASNQSASPGAR